MRTVAAVVLVGAALGVGGCWKGPDTFAITFVNDTGRRVQLKLCDDDSCHDFDYSDGLSVGGSHPENIDTGGVFTRWAVVDTTGRTLGCLPFRFNDRAYRSAMVRLSQMVACPGSTPLRLAHGIREF